MVEYELLLILIAIACIALLIIIGETVKDTFYRIGNEVPS